MDDRQELFDKFLSAGFAHVNENDPRYEHHADFFEYNYGEYLPKDKDAAILEIGYGMGQFLYFLEKKGYTNLSGVEVSSEMYDFAKKNIRTEVEKTEDLQKYLAEHAGMYDLVVFNDVIEHMAKDEIVDNLKLIRAALRKGGRVLIKTNNVAARTGARMRFEDFTHEWSFTPYSLRQVLLIAGFEDVIIQPFTFPVNSLTRFIRKFIQKLGHVGWRLTYWAEYTTQPEVIDEFMFATAKK